jgi:PAS domain S-box-containing protein
MSPFISKLFASRFGQAVIVAGAYYLAARFSLLTFETTNATAIWPPIGIALAAVLMLGYRIWPAIALGAFFANLDTLSALGFTTPLTLAGSFVTAVGNTLGVLAGGLLVLHFTKARNPFGRTMDIIKFVLFGALLGATVSAIFGACTLSVLNGRWGNFGFTWLTWWLGDAVGILIITPLIMTWERRRKSGWTPLKIAEAAGILALLAVIGWVVFGKGLNLPYMFIPLFIWTAFRFGLFEGACLILLTLCLSIWGATEGVFVYHEVTHTISLLLTQFYISIVSVMTMLLTSLITERNAAFADLRGSNEDLMQEINEHRRSEEALRETNLLLEQSSRFTEALLSAIPTPVFYKDREGRYLGCNRAFFEVMGVTTEEMKGKTVYELWPGEYAGTYHSKDLELMENPARQVYEFKVRDKYGVDRPVIYVKDVFRDENEQVAGIVGAFLDITERKQAEEKIRASLAEKEVLLKEVHHRVKNNLQIISTLLDLQFEDIHDEQSLMALGVSHDRIRSIALVHEKLYQTEDIARIDFAGYMESLTSHLYSSYVAEPERISLEIEVGNVALDIDKAIPCGLIINELVSNSLKHAFPEGRKGNITIRFHSDDQGVVTLTVADDGVGLPPGMDFRDSKSMGLQLVNMMTKQLQGEIESLLNEGGAAFTIRFKG